MRGNLPTTAHGGVGLLSELLRLGISFCLVSGPGLLGLVMMMMDRCHVKFQGWALTITIPSEFSPLFQACSSSLAGKEVWAVILVYGLYLYAEELTCV